VKIKMIGQSLKIQYLFLAIFAVFVFWVVFPGILRAGVAANAICFEKGQCAYGTICKDRQPGVIGKPCKDVLPGGVANGVCATTNECKAVSYSGVESGKADAGLGMLQKLLEQVMQKLGGGGRDFCLVFCPAIGENGSALIQ